MPVYLIRAGENGPVKIGWARDVRKRVSILQTGSHEPLTILRVWEGTRRVEVALHAKFAAHRQGGEWFALAPEMLGDVGYSEMTDFDPPPRAPEPVDTEGRDLADLINRLHAAYVDGGWEAARELALHEQRLDAQRSAASA